jgi:hypothetical protein
MANETKVPAVPATNRPKRPAPVKYATLAQFDELSKGVSELIGLVGGLAEKIKQPATAPTAEQTKRELEIDKATANVETVNPAWVEKANELIGESLDHCEVFYPKHGGTIFTLVIKKEFSNANPDYLERYKTDRRSKEIGNEGIEGVENWCKLVRDNLKRGK